MSETSAEGGSRTSRRHSFQLRLVGLGGEPVDLWRTLDSHGLNSLPPMELDETGQTLEITLPVSRGKPRTVRIMSGRHGHVRVEVKGRSPGKAVRTDLEAHVRHILRLDEDLSHFYERIAEDPELSWAAAGAGRMMRSPSVFEDVIKTICTTNCAWSATERMVRALVEHLGEPAAGVPKTGWRGRAFPTPERMAAAGEDFYQEVARAGYRSRYLHTIARRVADGELELEFLGQATPEELPDDELERRLLDLPGVGPYAAAHIMLLLGRYSRLIFDSWTRPKYARLVGKKSVADRTIERRFRRYGRYAGLAFWLFLTRDWVDEA
jgi:3-methyladenine DNA glycosylase/8-oxoguanine DNA glycosylase